MATRTGQLNRVISGTLTAADQVIACIIPNGDTARQIAIQKITLAIALGTAGDFSATPMGLAGIQVIMNHTLIQDGSVAYSVKSPTNLEGRSGEYMYFASNNVFGSLIIDFIDKPLLMEPAMNAVVIAPPPFGATGALLANNVVTLTVIGETISQGKDAWRLGNYQVGR